MTQETPNIVDYDAAISAATFTAPTHVRYQTTLASVTPNGDGTFALKLDVQRDNPNRFTRGVGNGVAAELSLANALGIPYGNAQERADFEAATSRLSTEQIDTALQKISGWMVNIADASMGSIARHKGDQAAG